MNYFFGATASGRWCALSRSLCGGLRGRLDLGRQLAGDILIELCQQQTKLFEVLGIQFIGIHQANAFQGIQRLAVVLREAVQYLQAFVSVDFPSIELVMGVGVLIERVNGAIKAFFCETACGGGGAGLFQAVELKTLESQAGMSSRRY